MIEWMEEHAHASVDKINGIMSQKIGGIRPCSSSWLLPFGLFQTADDDERIERDHCYDGS